MPAKRYPFVLKERLGDNAYDALVDMVDDRQNERLVAIETKLSAFTDRFDRVDDKLAAMRASFEHKLAAMSTLFDEKFVGMSALFDEKLSTRDARLEHRMTEEFSKVRLEINGLRTEMVAQRAHILKWALVTWIGQAAAVAAIVAVFR